MAPLLIIAWSSQISLALPLFLCQSLLSDIHEHISKPTLQRGKNQSILCICKSRNNGGSTNGKCPLLLRLVFFFFDSSNCCSVGLGFRLLCLKRTNCMSTHENLIPPRGKEGEIAEASSVNLMIQSENGGTSKNSHD